MKNISRRDFLRGASAGGALLLTSACGANIGKPLPNSRRRSQINFVENGVNEKVDLDDDLFVEKNITPEVKYYEEQREDAIRRALLADYQPDPMFRTTDYINFVEPKGMLLPQLAKIRKAYEELAQTGNGQALIIEASVGNADRQITLFFDKYPNANIDLFQPQKINVTSLRLLPGLAFGGGAATPSSIRSPAKVAHSPIVSRMLVRICMNRFGIKNFDLKEVAVHELIHVAGLNKSRHEGRVVRLVDQWREKMFGDKSCKRKVYGNAINPLFLAL